MRNLLSNKSEAEVEMAGNDVVAEIHLVRGGNQSQRTKEDKALKVTDVAKRLNCSRRQVFRLIEHGALAGLKLGARSTRITESELERFLAEGSRRS